MTNYVVLDFETTGLDYKKEQVIEIAAAKLDENLQPLGILTTFVSLNEGKELPPFITNLTGITPDDLEGQPTEAYAMQQLKDFIGDAIVVAQFASFDLAYLSRVLVPEQFICTRTMAKQLRPTERASLANLIEIYGIENLNPHRAYADVEATIQVFQKQKVECDEKGIAYMNVLMDSEERPLYYVPSNADVIYEM